LLTINQLYAIDVDKDMINFAEEKHHKNNIHYLLQDLSLEWDQLRSELKALEGKVSLIFSNHVLHWIKDKENAAKNLFRLLSKSGKLYAHIYWISDPFSDLKGEEKEIHEKEILKIPTKESQLNSWLNIFKTVGFEIIENELQSRKSIFDKQIFIKGMNYFGRELNNLKINFRVDFNPLFRIIVILPLGLLLRKQYFIEKNESKRSEVMNKISDDLFRRVLAKTRQFTDESNGKEMVGLHYRFFRFVLQKCSN
jgi:SAM-dependent methyltransferase